MREIISIFVGQAGVQVGNACTALMCQEHNISKQGNHSESSKKVKDDSSMMDSVSQGLQTFFYEVDNNKYVPRSIMVDLEPSVIDEVRNGSYGSLYHPDNLITGKEDAANNFARGKYTIGNNYIPNVMDKIRKLTDNCDGLQGFMLFNSVGGGTGSGFGTQLLSALNSEYGKKSRFGFTVYPSPQISSSVVEPYNAVLATQALMEYQDISILLDNEAIYDVCQKSLDIEEPTYSQLNDVIAQVYSSTTASLRHPGSLNVDLNEFQTNLVPYPRIHFVLSSYAPLLSKKKAEKQSLSVDEITKMAFEPSCMMAKCDPRLGKYMACSLNYRGNIKESEINSAVSKLKNQKGINFVNWCPTGFKKGMNDSEPVSPEGSVMAQSNKSLCAIANTTSISEVFNRIDRKFDLMFEKKAFVHWYVSEGMEEGEFTDARDDLAALEKDYENIGNEEIDDTEIEA